MGQAQSSNKRLTYGSQGHYRRTDVKGDVVNALLAQPQHARRMGVVCSAEESVASRIGRDADEGPAVVVGIGGVVGIESNQIQCGEHARSLVIKRSAARCVAHFQRCQRVVARLDMINNWSRIIFPKFYPRHAQIFA